MIVKHLNAEQNQRLAGFVRAFERTYSCDYLVAFRCREPMHREASIAFYDELRQLTADSEAVQKHIDGMEPAGRIALFEEEKEEEGEGEGEGEDEDEGQEDEEVDSAGFLNGLISELGEEGSSASILLGAQDMLCALPHDCAGLKRCLEEQQLACDTAAAEFQSASATLEEARTALKRAQTAHDDAAAAEGKARAASDAEQQKFNEIDAALRSFNAEPSSSACLETPGSGPSTLPSTPTTNMSILDKIRELAKFKSQGLIDEDEYKKMKARILE